LPRHYAPRTPLECAVDGSHRAKELVQAGLRIGRLALSDSVGLELPGVTTVRMPAEPSAYAAQLYATLHALDDAGLDRLVADLPPDREEWLAIRDRLRRASTPGVCSGSPEGASVNSPGRQPRERHDQEQCPSPEGAAGTTPKWRTLPPLRG